MGLDSVVADLPCAFAFALLIIGTVEWVAWEMREMRTMRCQVHYTYTHEKQYASP